MENSVENIQEVAIELENKVQEDVQVVNQVVNQLVNQVVNEVKNEVKNQVVDQEAPQVVDQVQEAPKVEELVKKIEPNPQKIPLVHYSSPTSLIYTVCGQVSHNLGKKTLTPNKSTIISVIHDVMGAIETVNMTKELKGKQKKDLAVDCLHWFVDQQEELSQEEKSFIHDSINLIAPDAIDVIANIGNGISDLVKNGLVKSKMCCCTIV
jgi:hypothetical protein